MTIEANTMRSMHHNGEKVKKPEMWFLSLTLTDTCLATLNQFYRWDHRIKACISEVTNIKVIVASVAQGYQVFSFFPQQDGKI